MVIVPLVSGTVSSILPLRLRLGLAAGPRRPKKGVRRRSFVGPESFAQSALIRVLGFGPVWRTESAYRRWGRESYCTGMQPLAGRRDLTNELNYEFYHQALGRQPSRMPSVPRLNVVEQTTASHRIPFLSRSVALISAHFGFISRAFWR